MFFHHLFFSCFVDIVLLMDGIHTLANVVIVKFTQTNLVSWAIFFRKVAVTMASDSLGERKNLSQLLPSVHVSSSCHRSFWVSS